MVKLILRSTHRLIFERQRQRVWFFIFKLCFPVSFYFRCSDAESPWLLIIFLNEIAQSNNIDILPFFSPKTRSRIKQRRSVVVNLKIPPVEETVESLAFYQSLSPMSRQWYEKFIKFLMINHHVDLSHLQSLWLTSWIEIS